MQASPVDRPLSRAAKAKEEATLAKIRTAASQATAEDRAAVAALLKRATSSGKDVAKVRITPGMAAILFLEYNKQNRDWSFTDSEKNAEELTQGEWQWNNQGIGLLTSGQIGDGQHRLAAIAISGVAVEMPVAFGMDPKAILTIDMGRRRYGHQYLAIQGLADNTKVKQRIVKRVYGYFANYYGLIGDMKTKRQYVLLNEREAAAAVVKHDKQLDECIVVGKDSLKGLSTPRALSADEAAAAAFLLNLGHWPSDQLRSGLVDLQIGQDREGGKSPMFVTADILTKDAQKRERVSMNAKLGAVVKAMHLSHQGYSGVRPVDVRAAMKPKALPDPNFAPNLMDAA